MHVYFVGLSTIYACLRLVRCRQLSVYIQVHEDSYRQLNIVMGMHIYESTSSVFIITIIRLSRS